MIRALLPTEGIPYELLLLADETREAINRYINDATIYVYIDGELLIGVYVLTQNNATDLEIKNIAVAENHQGKGIGTILLRDAAKRAKQLKFSNLLIGTANTAFKQLYLYQKEGFEIHAIKKNFFIDNYPEPIYESGIQLNHMIMLRKDLTV